MAAGQQKKRLNASSVISCNLQEQYRAKKKKYVESSQNLLNLRSHISLEWDNTQKKTVAKREQVGITWRHLAPFIDSVSHGHRSLADAFAIPQEIFELEDMTGVLSYEVWESHLSETERNFLTQFLPRGTDAEEAVKSLLMGENLHFGNPFLDWGVALCSGNLHPDAVLCQEKCFRANKKAYYSELQKYHNDIVETLQKWKERWTSCKDPERDIVQKIWRKGFAKDSDEKSSAVYERPEVAASSRKEEKIQKLYIHSGDSAKYMSYFKISRKQHQLVKRIKQSGDGIQSKSLNRVLGDIKSFHVQPYGVFEEEECKKLHEHWLQLAKRDLPTAFANWTERHLQRQQWRKSLEQEMAERKKPVVDEDEGKVNPDSWIQEDKDNRETDHEDTVEIPNNKYDEELVPHSTQSQPLQRIPSLNGHYELDPMYMESEEGNQDLLKPGAAAPVLSEFLRNMSPTVDTVEQVFSAASTNDSVPHSACSQPLQRSSVNGHHEIDPISMKEEGGRDIIKPEGSAATLSEFLRNTYPKEDAAGQEVFVPSTKDVWQAVSMPDSFYHPMPVSHGYTSVSSLGQPQTIEEQPTRVIDLETDILQQDARHPLLHRPSDIMGSAFNINNSGSFFASCTNQNQNELLPFLKGQGMYSSYSREHKQPGLHIPGTSNGSLETFHHPGHFQEQQLQLVEQTRGNDFDLHQVIQKNMYSNGGRYPDPGQEHFLPVDTQDWAIDPVHVSASTRSPSSFLGRNWFPGEHRTRGGWSTMDVSGNPGMYLGNGSSGDEGLYSVLPQHNKLQSSRDSMRTAQEYIPARNFLTRDVPRNSEISHQLNNLSGHEAAAATALKANNMSWMNMPHQNSDLHDSIGKPFLRSWNQ